MAHAVGRRIGPILGALAVGVASGAIALALLPVSHGADFAQFHFAAKKWISGADAYAGGFPVMRSKGIAPEPFFYPFPALLFLSPFAVVPFAASVFLFVGTSAALLGYAVIRH